MCEARLACCTRQVDHLHHRLRRSQGGGETTENLLAVCWACHEDIHRNPERSFALGHLLKQQPQKETT